MEDDFDPTVPPKLEGPLTPDLVEKWLLWLEGIATLERDGAFAMQFVLGTLLGALTRQGVIDGPQFLAGLRPHTARIAQRNYRVATEAFLDELATALPAPVSESQPDAPRH